MSIEKIWLFKQQITWCFGSAKSTWGKWWEGLCPPLLRSSWLLPRLAFTRIEPELFHSVSSCTILSPKRKKEGKQMLLLLKSAIFGRYLGLTLNLILFKLFFHANVCSLSNFGQFFAMLFRRTKKKMSLRRRLASPTP